MVGLKDKYYSFPFELSGGEKQRVAIARALITNPSLIVADEPTGSLDEATGEIIIDMLKKMHDMGKTIVMVTHNNDYTELGNKHVVLCDGEIKE